LKTRRYLFSLDAYLSSMIFKKPRWKSFESWCSTAFLAGGGLLLVCLAVVAVVEMVVSEPPLPILVGVMVSFLFGVLAVFVGLFGLYPRLHDRVPRLALAGVVFSMIAAAGLMTVVIGYLTAFVVFGPAEMERLMGARGLGYHVERFVFHMFYLGFPVAFLSFGVATFRARSESRVVAGLLMLAGALLLVNFAYEFSIWMFGMDRISDLVWTVTFGSIPITALLVGYLLRFRTEPTERPDIDLETNA
jgi:hypothetical protein